MVDFGYFLAQKYANLKQEADAGTTTAAATQANAATNAANAATQAIQAAAQSNALNAEAGLTKVKTTLAPAESAAQIGLQGAQTGLLGAQTTALPLTTTSEIGLRSAQADNFGAQTKLTLGNVNFSPFAGYTPPSLTAPTAVRTPFSQSVLTSSTATPTDPVPGETNLQRIARLRAAAVAGGYSLPGS